MRTLPNRNGGGQTPCAGFRQPSGSFAQVPFDDGNLNQAGAFEGAKVSGQSGLLQTHSLSQAPDRIVLCRSDVSHQTELSDAQVGGPHLGLQEVRDAARGEANVGAGAVFDDVARVGNERSWRGSIALCHNYMYIQ